MSLERLVHAMSVHDFLLSALVLVYNLVFLLYKADLNCLVTIIFLCLDLCHDTRTSLKYGYRNQRTVFVEDLSHSDFCSQYRFLHFLTSVCSTAERLFVLTALILVEGLFVFHFDININTRRHL